MERIKRRSSFRSYYQVIYKFKINFREVFKDLQIFSPNKFYFSNINLMELEDNIDNDRLFKNEQFFQYNSYNHTFYTIIKFVDFIYHDTSKNSQKGNELYGYNAHR